MTPTSRTFLLIVALCCGAALLPLPALAAAYEAPLEGQAWQQADLAYKSYQAGRYRDALEQVNAALKLRPDVRRLNLLQVYTLQKLGLISQARRAAQAALKRGVQEPGLRTALHNLQITPQASGVKAPSAAYQRGFPLATKGYAAYNAGDMPSAERDGESAFRTDPSQGAWAMLWLDAMEAQQKWAEAEQAAGSAITLGAPNASDLNARRQTLRRRMAVRPAEQAYQALIANHPGDAATLAREAVRLAPDIASHRLLLVTALLQDNQLAAAEQAANQALEQDDENTVMLVMRAYLRQLQGNSAASRSDFDTALAQDWLDNEQRRNMRLIAADGALASGGQARALALLNSLDEDDGAAKKRRAQIGTRAPAKLTVALYPAPLQSCQDTPYGTQCELLPSDAQVGPAGPATDAYAAYARKDYQEAIRQARAAVEQVPDNLDFQRLLTTALASGDAAQAAEAEQRLTDAIARTPTDAQLLMQRGYLRQRTGQPARARQDFRAARQTGKAPPTAILDEAFATSAMGDNPAAVHQLKHAIDMDDAKTIDLGEQQRYNTRSAIAGLDREWGATVSLGYRGAQPTVNVEGAGLSTSGDSVFSTAELYWRPTQFNNQSGILEVYGRLTNTLYDQGGKFKSKQIVNPCDGTSAIDTSGRTNDSRAVTGFPSTIGALGVRYMLSDTGLTFGLERRFFIGSATREGRAYPASNADRCAIQSAVQQANAKIQQINLRDSSSVAPINGVLTRYKLGSSAGSWLAYTTYGFYKGTELRNDASNWFTLDAYSQLGYSQEDNSAKYTVHDVTTDGKASRTLLEANGRLRREQLFLTNELRVGRSFRVSPNVVVFPHIVGAADWIWQKDQATDLKVTTDTGEFSNIVNGLPDKNYSLTSDAHSWSMGVGPGVNVRYWFREDHYNTPRSYLNWSMQYRFPIGGGATERAKGLFMNLTLSY